MRRRPAQQHRPQSPTDSHREVIGNTSTTGLSVQGSEGAVATRCHQENLMRGQGVHNPNRLRTFDLDEEYMCCTVSTETPRDMRRKRRKRRKRSKRRKHFVCGDLDGRRLNRVAGAGSQ
ncbi:hypothetical protein EYF80_059621 [Liparis tanakae]|uniref:Uncharacterized protein n=1 Tax=Liparis tanakae TaxID=230148 RepID=A0A4Z2EMQ9_9TELE|nr:hypothetical protein EYF80_059621 [Liparis tanakae]